MLIFLEKVWEWLKAQWYLAEGAPLGDVHGGTWKSKKTFRPHPPRCMFCHRYQRVGEMFIPQIGYIIVREERNPDRWERYVNIENVHPWPFSGLLEILWHIPGTEIYQSTGDLNDHLRYMCYNHRDKFPTMVVRDDLTGTLVTLPYPKGAWDLFIDKAVYFTRSLWRFLLRMSKRCAWKGVASRSTRKGLQ